MINNKCKNTVLSSFQISFPVSDCLDSNQAHDVPPRDRDEHRDDSFGAIGDARSDRKPETDAAVQQIRPAQIPGQQMTCVSAGDKRTAQVDNPLADL